LVELDPAAHPTIRFLIAESGSAPGGDNRRIGGVCAERNGAFTFIDSRP